MKQKSFIYGLTLGFAVPILLNSLFSNQLPSPAVISKSPVKSPLRRLEQQAEVEDWEINAAAHLDSDCSEKTIFDDSLKIPGLLYQKHFIHQDDDDTIAKRLYDKVKILCWIMTSPSNMNKKAIHVYRSWAHRCNVVLFMSSEANRTFPAPVIKLDVEEGRQHLTAKTMHSFKYAYDHYLDQADWFVKADDDTFMIVENMRYFLADKDPHEPVFYGHHFGVIVKPQGYYSGGGGYVLSKEALTRFATQGYHKSSICKEDGGAEDVQFGLCMQKLGVHTAESHDERGGSRFHALSPAKIFHGKYPDWYKKYDSHGAKFGIDSVSDYPISFHYVKPKEMYTLAYFTYHLKVYGHNGNNSVTIHKSYS